MRGDMKTGTSGGRGDRCSSTWLTEHSRLNARSAVAATILETEGSPSLRRPGYSVGGRSTAENQRLRSRSAGSPNEAKMSSSWKTELRVIPVGEIVKTWTVWSL